MIAADDCTHMVRILPTRRYNSVVKNPHWPVTVKKWTTLSFSGRFIAIAFSRNVTRPRNMNEKPKINSPNDLPAGRFWKINAIAIANNGNTTLLMFIWKPNTDIIQAVTVVPMFAPMMTEIACANVRSPAFTKLTVITVVAVDDCTAAVTKTPVSNPVKRFLVMVPIMLRRCPPLSFCNPQTSY